MIYKSTNRPFYILAMLILALPTFSSVASPEETRPLRPKRVITNEDLQKYQENSGVESKAVETPTETDSKSQETTPYPAAEAKVPSSTLPSTHDREALQAKLKEADDVLLKAKKLEEHQINALSGFKKSLAEAQTDFARQTVTWQIEDTEINLARAAANRKKAEEHRAMLSKEAEKKKQEPLTQ